MADTAPQVAYVPQQAGNALAQKRSAALRPWPRDVQANVAQKAANASFVPPMMPDQNNG